MTSRAALFGLRLICLLVFALPFFNAAPARAHAVLVASDPVDGSTLTTAPARVSLTFDEPVRMIPGAVQVISSAGPKVDRGARLLSGGTVIELTLPADLGRGSYTAMWRLISADGHEVSGSVSFGVGQSPNAPPPTAAPDHSVAVGSGTARAARYAGLVLCVGVLATCGLLWNWALALRRTRVMVAIGWILLATATTLDCATTGPDATLYTQAGLVALLGGAAWAVLRGSRWGKPILGIVATGLAVNIAASGHATGSWPAVASTTGHLLAMTVWLGGLCVLTLIVLPAKRSDGLDRWSRVAFGCVAAVALTGEYQAWRQVSPVESLWHTSYGLALCAKLFLMALMLGLAYLGRRRLAPERLRRTVPIEAAVGVLVLLATTVLTGEPPARTSFGPALTATASLDSGRQARVHFATTRHGAIPIDVTVTGATAVQGMLSSAEIAALPVHFTAGPDGQWHSTYATAPRSGLWTLRLSVQFSPSDAVVTNVPFQAW
ncbi:MAG: copper resistance protein CopC [Mycobacterium sp.]